MDARDPAEAAEILDLLLTFFGGGERWIKGRFSDRRGKCCLVGALDLSAAITPSKATRPSGISPMCFPTGVTGARVTRMARTFQVSGVVSPCRAGRMVPGQRSRFEAR